MDRAFECMKLNDKKTQSIQRGPYNGARTRYKGERPVNYLRVDHENQGRFISWADVLDRGNGKIYVQYKFTGDRCQYKAPREKTVWLDQHGLEFAKVEIQKWKEAHNSTFGVKTMMPEFYLSHRKEFVRWLNKSARDSTIQGYESALTNHIFPYFVGKLKLSDPKKWDATCVRQWEVTLVSRVEDPASRNRIRTAFRRYLKFLLSAKGIILSLPTLLNETEVRDSKETPIPGELPDWAHVAAYFRKMRPSRMRFVKAVEATFGVRVSEAMVVDESDFMGSESEKFINDRNDYVRKVKDAQLAVLFLFIDSAKKKKVNKDILRLLGADQDTEPKSGKYIACCTSLEMGELITEMLESGEHRGDISYDEVNKFRREMPVALSSFKFSEYRDHDYRRLNITLQALDLNIEERIDICCEFHGQENRETFKRYFQWGLVQRRNQGRDPKAKITLFKTKNI
jgi:hypothetical protein